MNGWSVSGVGEVGMSSASRTERGGPEPVWRNERKEPRDRWVLPWFGATSAVSSVMLFEPPTVYRAWDVSEHGLFWKLEVLAAPLPNLQKSKPDPAGSAWLSVTPTCHVPGDKKTGRACH